MGAAKIVRVTSASGSIEILVTSAGEAVNDVKALAEKLFFRSGGEEGNTQRLPCSRRGNNLDSGHVGRDGLGIRIRSGVGGA